MLVRLKQKLKRTIYKLGILNFAEKFYCENTILIFLNKYKNHTDLDKESIKNIYDIGCHKGIWSEEIRDFFPNANIYQFDAVNHKKKNLKNTYFYEVCLGLENEKKYFYTKGLSGDSLFKEKDNISTKVKYTEKDKKLIEVFSLDDFISAKNIPKPDYIKIDAQGAELLILRGGKDILKDTKFIQLEVSYVDYNLEGCMVEDILKYMRLNNYLPVAFNHIRGDTCNIIQGDILFHKFSEYDYFQ